MWDYLAEHKEKGLIRNLGLSYHNRAEELTNF